MEKYSLIRTLYLYIFTAVGLVLLIIGLVNFINLGLKVFVFTEIEKSEQANYRYPYYSPLGEEKMLALNEENKVDTEKEEICVTGISKEAIENWTKDYQEWKDQTTNFDPIKAQRQRETARNLAMIIVGLPLYLYHWRLIKKDVKEKNK